jgi:hypothetical protein
MVLSREPARWWPPAPQPVDGTRNEHACCRIRELDRDALELERAADPVGDGLEHRVDAARLTQAQRHLQKVRERRAVPRRGLVRLRILDRERDVISQRDEDVELTVVGAAQRIGLVDGHHSEQGSVRCLQRYEKDVVRMPRVRIVGDRVDRRCIGRPRPAPVVRARQDDVRAPAQEAFVEQRPKVVPRPRAPHERRARLLAPADRRHAEVVPGRAIERDRDRLIPERLADRPCQVAQALGQAAARTGQTGHLD